MVENSQVSIKLEGDNSPKENSPGWTCYPGGESDGKLFFIFIGLTFVRVVFLVGRLGEIVEVQVLQEIFKYR